MLQSATIILFAVRRTAMTFPFCPACGPSVTCTTSPFTIFHLVVTNLGLYLGLGFISILPTFRPHLLIIRVLFMVNQCSELFALLLLVVVG